jgi:hypothetical protein
VGATTFAIVSGALPAGMSLSSAGVISGTPSTFGTFTFTVTATDANGCAGSRTFTLVVECPTLSMSGGLLPPARTAIPYQTTITADGVSGTPTFALTSGALPGGLTLSNAGRSGTAAPQSVLA